MNMDNGLFDQASTQTYHKFFELLSYNVDYYIYLDGETEVALERIKKRDRCWENNITLDYLKSLRKQYEESTAQNLNVFCVDANVDSEIVEQRLRSILNLIISSKDLLFYNKENGNSL